MTSEEDDLRTPFSNSLAKSSQRRALGVMTSEEDGLQPLSSHSLANNACKELSES